MHVSLFVIASASSPRHMKDIMRNLLPHLFISTLFGFAGAAHTAQTNYATSLTGANEAPPNTQVRSDQTSAASFASGQAQTADYAANLPTLSADFHVSIYANVPFPEKLSFAPDGALYVGSSNDRIHKVDLCGGSVSEFGPPQIDPDAVLFDASGRISGVPNSVLVGGGGILAAIFQDQTSAVIFNSGFADVDDMKFDHRGRLVFSDDLPRVLVSKGGPPTVLFSTANRPNSIAIDDHNRIFLSIADGTIRIYNADGTVADNAFATGLAGFNIYLAFGPGEGGFGKALYVLNGTELLRFNKRGEAATIGSGFSVGPASATGFVFGPDKSLYVSDYPNNRILKITKGHHEGEHEAGHEGPHCPKH
jgi:sugar lactone lactonase YvrE